MRLPSDLLTRLCSSRDTERVDGAVSGHLLLSTQPAGIPNVSCVHKQRVAEAMGAVASDGSIMKRIMSSGITA